MSDVRPTIPQSSPGGEYLAHRAEIDDAIARVLESGWYILGREVEAFEEEFARYLGLAGAVGVANGTDALELALRAIGVGPGDAVFTVSHTAVATVAAIERAGAVPVLVDIDEGTFTMDPARLEDAIAEVRLPPGIKAKAVVVVHLYGQPAAMPAIVETARRCGLRIVEDCAQAHGARLDGRTVGTFGDVASFSFYPTKNLGALGDGGLVASDNASVVTRVRELRQYGWRERYVSATTGSNSRLDELQAAILRVKLRHLDAGNERRRVFAGLYDSSLGSADVRTPAVAAGAEHVYHQYVIRAIRRNELMAWLRERGIETAIHYPVPVHLQPAYAGRVPVPRPLDVTERLAGEIVSLPIFPAMADDDAIRVADGISGLGLRDIWSRSGIVIHYCTYFDQNYLTRAMALHRSLVRHSPPFTLWALCFDDEAHAALEAMQLSGVRPIAIADLEAADPELVAVRDSRTTIEYYFTCSPSLPLFVMRQHPEVDLITYLDADLLFYSSPQPIFDELDQGSVLIVPHRFPEALRRLEVYGVYNVGLLCFRNDEHGRAVLERWREQCIEWCFDRVEDGRFADQRYLDPWPSQPGVVVLEHPGAGVGPWNFMRYRIDLGSDPPSVDGRPLIFYHFQGVKEIRPRLWDVGLDNRSMDRRLKSWLYRGYIRELKSAAQALRLSLPIGRIRGLSIRQNRYTWKQVVGRIRRGQVMVSFVLPFR